MGLKNNVADYKVGCSVCIAKEKNHQWGKGNKIHPRIQRSKKNSGHDASTMTMTLSRIYGENVVVSESVA